MKMQINQKRLGFPRSVEIKSMPTGDESENTLKNRTKFNFNFNKLFSWLSISYVSVQNNILVNCARKLAKKTSDILSLSYPIDLEHLFLIQICKNILNKKRIRANFTQKSYI